MTLTISRRLGLLAASATAIAVAIIVVQLMALKDSLLHERQAALKMQVEQAASIVQTLGEAAAKGRMTKEAAQQRAAEAVRAMRFGQGEYFFVYDFKGTNVVHGLKPEYEGSTRLDTKDPTGKRYIAEMIDLAKAGKSGYVGYAMPRQGSDVPKPKLSYPIGYGPWEWMIGTGVYLDDLDDVFWDKATIAGIWAVALLAILNGCAWFLARGMVFPIRGLIATMGRLTAGEIETKVDGQERRDEIGAMARAVQVFKDNAVALRDADSDKQRLSAEAEATRHEHDAANAAREERQGLVVKELAARLSRLAEGDLTARLAGFPGEYKTLETDFNAAMARLQEAMQAISAKTAAMRGGTGEISQAADDLSRRTEQQAASLEETAAALDEITATVRKTADGATHARQAVSTAKSDAERSGEVVRDAVDAMGAIETSAKEISQIIGVIDEIAFQTNLLALNAGVEAARAGEAGRGFAVVAQEVRALAQRSAEAAKEIKTLISASSAQVASGVSLVGETGKTLDRIVAQVAEINGIVAEIAASAAEQSTALAEVNTAVNQMDQVTQQNAAMVEETTAASHSLASEADELAGLVGRFELGSAPAQAAKTAPRAAPPRAALRTVGGRGISAQRKLEPAAQDEWEEF